MFVNTIRSRIDLARHVKRLCVSHDGYHSQDLRCLLDVLTGICYLAWWCDINDLLPYTNTSLASVRYFSTVAYIDSPLIVETLLPRNITHLNVRFEAIDVPFGDSLSAVWKAVFTRCPSLTHIMVDFFPCYWSSEKEQFVRSALSVAPPTFKAFIIEFQNAARPLGWDISEFRPLLTDSRFIIVSAEPLNFGLEGVLCYPKQQDPFLDWQDLDVTSLSDHMDIWDFVDSHTLRSG